MLPQRHDPFMPSLEGGAFEGSLDDIVLEVGMLGVTSTSEMTRSVASFVPAWEG
jgi:hypothetical protein